MTPALLDCLQARPHCRRRRMIRDGQHGVHFTCHEPMSYDRTANSWDCFFCGRATSAATVVSREIHNYLEAA